MMVNVSTLIGIGLIGAIGVGIYGVYNSRNAIGQALSRGIETTVTNPITDWANSLFKTSQNDKSVATTDQEGYSSPPPIISSREPKAIPQHPLYVPNYNNDYVPGSNEPADERTWTKDYFPPADQDFKPPPKPKPKPSKGTYYYADFAESELDTQLFFKPEHVQNFLKSVENAPNFKGLYNLGVTKPLGKSGFELYGKSKGYL